MSQSEAQAGINGILMRSIMKSYPETDHFSMVPIKGCECPALDLVNLSQLMPLGHLEIRRNSCCATSQVLMVNGQLLSFESNRKEAKGSSVKDRLFLLLYTAPLFFCHCTVMHLFHRVSCIKLSEALWLSAMLNVAKEYLHIYSSKSLDGFFFFKKAPHLVIYLSTFAHMCLNYSFVKSPGRLKKIRSDVVLGAT